MRPYARAIDSNKRQKKDPWLGVPSAKKSRSNKKSARQSGKKEVKELWPRGGSSPGKK